MNNIQQFRTIRFCKRVGEEEFYAFTAANKAEMQLLYHIREDRFFLLDHGTRALDVAPEAREQFLSARRRFAALLYEISNDSKAFFLIRDTRCLIAYRREHMVRCKAEKPMRGPEMREDIYRFVVLFRNGNVLQYLCTAQELLDQFDFTTNSEGSLLREKNISAVIEGNCLLYRWAEKHDRHLYITIKHLAGLSTQKETDPTAALDGKLRLVPEKKFYTQRLQSVI